METDGGEEAELFMFAVVVQKRERIFLIIKKRRKKSQETRRTRPIRSALLHEAPFPLLSLLIFFFLALPCCLLLDNPFFGGNIYIYIYI